MGEIVQAHTKDTTIRACLSQPWKKFQNPASLPLRATAAASSMDTRPTRKKKSPNIPPISRMNCRLSVSTTEKKPPMTEYTTTTAVPKSSA